MANSSAQHLLREAKYVIYIYENGLYVYVIQNTKLLECLFDVITCIRHDSNVTLMMSLLIEMMKVVFILWA